MRVISNLAGEFELLCADYINGGVEGKDLVALVMIFGDEYDHLGEDDSEFEFTKAWTKFLGEHKHQVTVQMVGLLLNTLVTYWPPGEKLYAALPVLEKILLRETIQNISDYIAWRSAENGNQVLTVPE